jgi:hypothetical protein
MATFPSIAAGQRITASLLNSMLPVTVTKTVNQSVTSSTTLVNDLELTLPVVANGTYLLDGFIDYDGQFGPGTGDIKFDWSLPSGATLRWGPLGNASNDTSQKYASNTNLTGNVLTAGTYGTGGAHNAATPRGYVTVSSTAGNIQLMWAQNVSSATATSVYAGSWIRLTRTS